MVHMQLTNNKLVDRGTRYLVESLGLSYEEAGAALQRYGSVQKALEALQDKP
jgi:N-acetylmuramic acid 6-phosphate etherase